MNWKKSPGNIFFCVQLKTIRNEFPFSVSFLNAVRTLGNISVVNVSVYKQFNVTMKRAYRGPSRRRPTRMQEAVTLMELQERSE